MYTYIIQLVLLRITIIYVFHFSGFIKYRAIYEFSARNADEISFQPGDIILVPIEQNAEPGWLAGEINGHTGWFPETYVEKIDSSSSVVTTISNYNTQDNYVDNKQLGYNEFIPSRF